jgi:DNA-binding response OmpR family regulator
MKSKPKAHSGRSRVLLVEDEHLLAWSMAHALEKEGVDSFIAASGEDALTALMSQPFDLMITDLELPEIDGATVATVAKKGSPGLPVIMISALEGTAPRRMESRHIVDHFVEKPFDMNQIVRLVKECLAERTHARTI